MISFSFDNLARVGSATIAAASTTFLEAGHPATAVQDPTRPFLRAYSLDLSAQILTLNFGATTALDVLALINPNFTGVTIRGNGSDTWGSPAYTSGALVLGRSVNDRYHHAHRPTVAAPFARQYASLAIPNQATTDGLNRFALGGIWAGLITLPPMNILMDPDEEKIEPRLDIKTPDGRTLQRLKLDDPLKQITCTRLAEGEAELAAWREIDRRWSAAPGQAALVMLRDSYPAETYVMRQVSVSKWRHARVWSRSEMVLLEITAG